MATKKYERKKERKKEREREMTDVFDCSIVVVDAGRRAGTLHETERRPRL